LSHHSRRSPRRTASLRNRRHPGCCIMKICPLIFAGSPLLPTEQSAKAGIYSKRSEMASFNFARRVISPERIIFSGPERAQAISAWRYRSIALDDDRLWVTRKATEQVNRSWWPQWRWSEDQSKSVFEGIWLMRLPSELQSRRVSCKRVSEITNNLGGRKPGPKPPGANTRVRKAGARTGRTRRT
jgi:hypothetical protein